MNEEKITSEFINEALKSKLHEVYPSIPTQDLPTVVKVVHNDVMKKKGRGLDAVMPELVNLGVPADAAPRLTGIVQDIGSAVVGLGGDMEDGIGQIIWFHEQKPAKPRARKGKDA